MRILMTSTGAWGTGSFFVMEAVAKELRQQGHVVKELFPDSGAESTDRSKYYSNLDWYEVWRFPIQEGEVVLDNFPLMIPDPHPRNLSGITYKDLTAEQLELFFNKFSQKIQQVYREFKPDIIECQHLWSMDYVIDKLKLPYIPVAHYSDQLGFEYDPGMRERILQVAQHSKYIFAVSEHIRRKVIELYQVSPAKVITINNGYDEDIFQPLHISRAEVLRELKLDIADDTEIITFTGKLSHTKGIDILLDAICLLQKTQSGLHFLIFGAGDVAPDIQDKLSACEMADISLLGHCSPELIARAHNIAKLSVLPSRHEGFGLAILEAMGCGIPVVVTEDTGPAEFAVGKVVAQEDPEQLAAAILEIIKLPPKKYQKLAKQALAKARQFSWVQSAQQRLQYYKKYLRD